MEMFCCKLRAENHLLRVEEPRYKKHELPEVDYTLFHQDKVNSARRNVRGLEHYLCETYLFYDDLSDTNDPIRDEVEIGLMRKYGEECKKMYEQSRLRGNQLSPVLSNIHYLAEDLKKLNERITEISEEMIDKFFGKYKNMTNAERLQFSEDLLSRAYEVLQILSGKNQKNNSLKI